ncbi:MAG: hypothetical protein ACOWWR_05975 [Eubacteriales bacterium]
MRNRCIVFVFLMIITTGINAQTIHFVRNGATGLNNGTDWINAYTDLPDILVRGDTYYIADGVYDRYTFDDALIGTEYIKIVKAIPDDYGEGNGWMDSYGDGVAVFNDGFLFITGYYEIDGQVGGGPESWFSGFGFKLQGYSANVKLVDLRGPDWYYEPLPDNISISHTEIVHRGRYTGDMDDGIYTIAMNKDGTKSINQVEGSKNVTISYCYLHDFGRFPIQTHSCSNWIVEYTCIARNSSNAEQHSEGWQDFGSDDIIARYNLFIDCTGTGFIVLKKNYPQINENWDVYGNIFLHTEANRTTKSNSCGHGVFTQSLEETTESINLNFFNNTIINVGGWASGVWFPNGVNVNIYNNLWYRCDAYLYGTNITNLHLGDGSSVKYDYNTYIQSPLKQTVAAEHDEIIDFGNPFVDWQNFNFNLTSNTSSGKVLDEKYAYDMFGNYRKSWTRGAIELIEADSFMKPSGIRVFQ